MQKDVAVKASIKFPYAGRLKDGRPDRRASLAARTLAGFGYTDIEMETGPYLSAIYENLYPKRYPINEIVNLFQTLPYDLGVLHYASDTPYSKRQSLLSKSMLYFGMDSTYAGGVAIVRRILENEMGMI
jgi:hypothetical protein